MSLWERPCVAKGLRSSPRVSGVLHKPGLLRSPFATQGRSHIHTSHTHSIIQIKALVSSD